MSAESIILFILVIILFIMLYAQKKKERQSIDSILFQIEGVRHRAELGEEDLQKQVNNLNSKIEAGTTIDINPEKIQKIVQEELSKAGSFSNANYSFSAASGFNYSGSGEKPGSNFSGSSAPDYQATVKIKTNNIRHDLGQGSVFFGHWRVKTHTDPEQVKRISTGLKIPKNRIMFFDPMNQIMKIAGSSGECYDVTLDSCTCTDFKRRRKPCKHIYRLAYECGYLDTLPEYKKENSSFNYDNETKRYLALYKSGSIDRDTYVKLCDALKKLS